MPGFLRHVFSSDGFMPHGHCFLWKPGLIWLHVSADVLIGLSYVAISLTLAYLVHRARRDIPFHWMLLAFGTFIIACGATHFMEVWTLWVPVYWFAGDVKLLTAAASVATAVVLPALVPRALALIEAAKTSEDRKAKLEVTHLELAGVYERLKELDTLKTQFFANVSHELRTPLSLIVGPTEKLLAAGGLDDRQRHDLEVVGRNARTLLKHVNDLLDVAKLEAGKMAASYARVDLARLVRLVAGHFDGLGEERRIALSVEAPEEVRAELDAAKIERVFLNLLSNAFKFTPAGGAVRCRLAVAGGCATLSVEDTGPGVPPELRPLVFDRFRQAEGGPTRSFGGTGLGLSIAKEFTELHGGTIAVDDAPGGGARFTVTLPLVAPAGVAVRSAPEEIDASAEQIARQALEELRARVEAVAGGPEVGGPRVLVAEDNPEMNRYIAEVLGADYRIDVAHDGAEALATAEARCPDLIITDVMMPRMSGDQLLRALRDRPAFDGVPIVILTARADDELRVRLLRSGAQDYVMKPFSADELRARVANLVIIKRTREVLQHELASQVSDLEALAAEVTFRKRELRTALDAMRVARDQAEQASRAKSDFLSLVSHELRTPLTAIRTYLHLLERDGAASLLPRQRSMVEKTVRSSARLLALVESLLEYTRAESGQLVTDVAPLDLGALAADVVEEMRPLAEQKQLALHVAAPPALPPLLSDAQLVRLILVNLIGNGIKYTEQGGVEVSVSHDEGVHRLAVIDSGPGIPADRQRVIFEPFTQLEPVRHKHTPGVGLGLALVERMVAALGGRVELRSELGCGSEFTVVLPPAPPQALQASARAASAPHATPRRDACASPTVQQ